MALSLAVDEDYADHLSALDTLRALQVAVVEEGIDRRWYHYESVV